MARSLAHQHSTAAISDRAGERLADDMMAPLGERERRQGEAAAAAGSGSSHLSGSVSGLSGAGSGSRRGVTVQPVQPQPPPQRGPSLV